MQGADADQKLARKILTIHKKFPTKDSLINAEKNNQRKEFGKSISNRAYTAAGIPADVKADLQQIVPSPSDIKDSHLLNNNFKTRDIYGAFIPNGKFAPTDSHGTYSLGIEGTFLGTPDRIVNIEDILTEEFMDRFAAEEQLSNYEEALEKDPDAEMPALPTRAQALSGIAGRQAGFYEIQGKEFRATTAEELGDAVDKSKPATAEQMAEGADAIRKKQLRRTPSKFLKSREPRRSETGLARELLSTRTENPWFSIMEQRRTLLSSKVKIQDYGTGYSLAQTPIYLSKWRCGKSVAALLKH